jgi:hypothetical protein
MQVNKLTLAIFLFIVSVVAGIPLFNANRSQSEAAAAEQTMVRFFESLRAGDAETFFEIWRHDREDIVRAKAEFTGDSTLTYTILSTERVAGKDYLIRVDLFKEGESSVMRYPVRQIDGIWTVDVANATQE